MTSPSWTCERQDGNDGEIYWAIHDALTYEFIANVYSNQDHAQTIAAALDMRAALSSKIDKEAKLLNLVKIMLEAIDNGTVDSDKIDGDYETGIPPHKWHDKWVYFALEAVLEQEG